MSIRDNFLQVVESIAETAEKSGRNINEITLCAVSKFFPLSAVKEAYDAGARVFGESRVQELSEKFAGWYTEGEGGGGESSEKYNAQIHMIGSLQTNKVKKALSICSCVQSVDRESLILELQKCAVFYGKKIDILFEINSGEDSKSGYKDEASFFNGVETALSCGNINIKGLMTIAPFDAGGEGESRGDAKHAARRAFNNLYKLREKLVLRYPKTDWSVLSMGMSQDYQIAVEEGSTMVRIGTAIFGARGSA